MAGSGTGGGRVAGHKVHSANQQPAPFRIVVGDGELRFAAAHFTVTPQEVEPLHGHNYRLTVEVWGELAPEGWVMDFRQLRAVAAALCRRLDHRFLLPTRSPWLQVQEEGASYRLQAGGRTYILPKEDCIPLPLDNTTAERLAQWLAGELRASLPPDAPLRRLLVGVEEAPGQSGWYAEDLCQEGGGHGPGA